MSVDGRPLPEVRDAYVAGVGLVAQRVHLLDADLATNITLTYDARERDERRLAEVIAAVGLDAFAEPGVAEGELLGEKGARLSGGERQRVSVARALYRDVSVLLVDEGTSALDVEAKRSVLDLLANSSSDRITVVITHDPELAAGCDRILRLEAGRLVADESAAVPT
jgi:ABC-type transport system involved in cytochrome bd biosynthesis fused ATPase/permease subunit